MKTPTLIQHSHTQWSSTTIPDLGPTRPDWIESDQACDSQPRPRSVSVQPFARFRRSFGVFLLAALGLTTGAGTQSRAGTITVTSLADDGPGTLRRAIVDA